MKARLSRWLNKVTSWRNVRRQGIEPISAASQNFIPSTPDSDPLMALAIHTRVPLSAVLPVAAHIDAAPWINLANLQLERTLAEYIERDTLPIPAAANREGYHGERHYDYWLSGLKDYLQIKQTLAQHHLPFPQHGRVLELGCATGRVLRHFICQEPAVEMWGVDINLSHIEWLLQFFGSSPKVFQNSVLPQLPIADNSIDLIYAFSVFTHLDEFELAWLAELRRILKPGGVAYITVHTDHTWQILSDKHALFHHLLSLQAHFADYKISPELFAKPMQTPRIAFKWQYNGMKNANLFHSKEYLCTTWGRFLQVLEIIPEGADYHDVILLRKEIP